MSTSVTTAGQISFSTLCTTTNAVSSSPKVLQASTTADTAETGTRRQQVIDMLTEKLAVYSEQYHQLLNKGILIDTTPAQGVLKSSLSRFMNTGVSSKKSVGEPLEDSAVGGSLWDITFDKNMDKDGDGKIDDHIDFSTYIWSNDNDHGNGVKYPESDWEIYADVSTELVGLQTDYMDVYTDLANQSVEFLNDVNSFKSQMVTFVSTDDDDMKIDVGGVMDELDAIIYGWGIYDANGNINLTPINPETTSGPYPELGPVAIRGLDAQGVYYWATQLELSDQLAIETHTEAGADGKMYTGNPEDDIDNITVADSVANLNEPPESDCRLYMVAEADGTYTLYVYPDLQPVRDGQDATFSLIGSDAGTSTAAEAPTASDIGLSPNDSRYYGNDGDEKSYSVISPSEDMVIVPMSTISSKNFNIPAGYTLITSRDTDDYKEYDCFLIPTSMLDPAETNSEAGNSNASVRLTESVVVLDKSYDMNGKGILSDKANIYVSPALTWDFEAHNSGEFATISSGMFNEWENSMNTMSSTVESQSQVMSEKLSQANTIFNNLTKVLSSTIEALLETQKEFLK
ncbi:IpaD/SipD/SspD family type III secretion system needle tip protein [Citrobacter freundii]|uniref:IpaD/SipD/SspD family type III secretion system needle tip protein n=1 Tax=Citrobacter freundii TaxID=546 RepID=A0AAP5XTK6_CITFR|nr:IpaD/SipD/SspD family type III secretion system needle tip protein [Citrobacter freundii]ELT3492604.1 IpaD/SipD/SspD family type III secretion system needle tip protein [Citrobacter freundii]MCW0942049.1 IpaD/SipD/SspD family type III secretion system needle tip protein [Citrobacter freundii]MDV2192140.1 IpaD/SipD/SspD family type III secretion system needle tip protein [Citrobacter freundii]MDW2758539.1 IpaD/SipD/SspD family type III secretion system needle tip protein [Citrobacter freundii